MHMYFATSGFLITEISYKINMYSNVLISSFNQAAVKFF